jgi:Cu/Ag efflux pump CusA
VNGVEDMLYMSSQATSDGVLTLTVTFKLGTDPDKAQQLVQNRVSQAEPRLPAEVRALGVTTVKSSPDFIMVVNLVSDRYDITYLRNYATLNVKDRLTRIQGVGQVQVFGAGDYSMRVWIDPQKAAEHSLAASDISNAIRSTERPGGGRHHRRIAQPARCRPAAQRERPGAPAHPGGVRQHHRQERRKRRDHAVARRRPHRTRRGGLYPALAA